MSMHSFKAMKARYPLPSFLTMSTVLPLTNPATAGVVTFSIFNVMNSYHEEHYAQILPLPRAPADDTDDTDVTSRPDDPTEPQKRFTSTRRRDESDLAKAMDELNMVLMYIHGFMPEMAAERRQK